MTGDTHGKDWVAIILAVGIATAINLVTIASLWVAIAAKSDVEGGLSSNATTLLTTAFGGVIGVLGGFVGYRAGQQDEIKKGNAMSEQTPEQGQQGQQGQPGEDESDETQQGQQGQPGQSGEQGQQGQQNDQQGQQGQPGQGRRLS